jgi:threonine dehydrogenase-like Zn-dependent dehydrogenase
MYHSQAIVFDGSHPRRLEVADFDLPEPGPGELVLRTELAAICGSDLHMYNGWYERGRVVPGHEFVGRVVAMGGDVEDAAGRPLAVGDRVVPESQVPCHRCLFCRRYDKIVDYNACESYYLFGAVPIGDPPRVVGGWSQFVEVPREALVHRTEEGSSLEATVLLEPLAVATKAVLKAGVLPGETVVVQGPGPVGLLTSVAARVAGASQVILVGPNEARLRVGESLGVDKTVDIRDDDPVDALADLTAGKLADRVIDASGAIEAFEQGLNMTGRGGVYVNIGGFRPTDEVTFRPDRIKREKIDIRFSHLGSNAYQRALSIIKSKRFPLENLVTHRFPLEEAERALLTLEGHEGSPVKVVLTPA